MEDIVKENPRYRLLSKAKLIKAVRDKYDVPIKDINAWYDSRELSQVYKPTKSKKDNQLHITAEPFSFQIDIVKLPTYKKYNNGVEQFLLLVDITSRKAFAYPMKSGKMEEVMDKYEQFLKDVGEDVKSVAGDDFFNNDEFLEFNHEMGINVSTDVAQDDHLTAQGNKLGIIDRLVRTLKMNIQKYTLEFNTMKWVKFLDDVIEAYNDASHSSLKTGFTPNEVFDDPDYAEKVHEAIANKNKEAFDEYDFDIGDTVRTQLGKKTFEKEKQKYSTQIYMITAQEGYRYALQDDSGKKVKRRYRPSELLKVQSVTDRINDEPVKRARDVHKKANKLRNKDELNVPYETAAKMVTQAAHARGRETRSQATKTRAGTTRRRNNLY